MGPFSGLNFEERRFQNGQAHQEGRRCRQVRHSLWRLSEENRQEDGGVSALQVSLHLLWQGEHEEEGCRHLEVDVKNCRITVAGGAWTYATTNGASVRSQIRRLRETEELNCLSVFVSVIIPTSDPGMEYIQIA